MIKKSTSLLLTAILSLGLMFGIAGCDKKTEETNTIAPPKTEDTTTAYPETTTADSFLYNEVTDGENNITFEIKGLKAAAQKTTKHIVTPSEYEGIAVTAIGDGAFHNNFRLLSATIGSSIKSIGDHGFENCPNLASFTIENSGIGGGCFANCNSLANIYIVSTNKNEVWSMIRTMDLNLRSTGTVYHVKTTNIKEYVLDHSEFGGQPLRSALADKIVVD